MARVAVRRQQVLFEIAVWVAPKRVSVVDVVLRVVLLDQEVIDLQCNGVKSLCNGVKSLHSTFEEILGLVGARSPKLRRPRSRFHAAIRLAHADASLPIPVKYQSS